MKNLIIAALAAMEIMDRWYIYCRSEEDMILCAFAVFYFMLLLLWRLDKYIARRRRIHETSKKIERLISQPVKPIVCTSNREQVVCK